MVRPNLSGLLHLVSNQAIMDSKWLLLLPFVVRSRELQTSPEAKHHKISHLSLLILLLSLLSTFYGYKTFYDETTFYD